MKYKIGNGLTAILLLLSVLATSCGKTSPKTTTGTTSGTTTVSTVLSIPSCYEGIIQSDCCSSSLSGNLPFGANGYQGDPTTLSATVDNFGIAVPEPSTLVLLATALLGLLAYAWRRRR